MAGISESSGWRLLGMYEGGGSDALVPATPGGANNTLLGNDEIRYLSLLWQSKPDAHVGEYRRQFMMDMNVFVSESAIWNALNNTLRLTRKKKTKEVFRKFLPANQVKFKHYMERVVQMQDWQLRFFDETACSSRRCNGRDYARSPEGERARDTEVNPEQYRYSCNGLTSIARGCPPLIWDVLEVGASVIVSFCVS
jgi:hypothetical protein